MESTAPKPFVFVLMPFGPEFDDVYQLGIKAACQEAGTYCERLDEQIFHENMLNRIYNQISKADIIVADMSGRNPNVFYEVGYAHALGKIVVLITSKSEDIPFDLKHYQHIVYNGKIALLKERLVERVLCFCSTKNMTDIASNVLPSIYINDVLLSENALIPAKNINFFRMLRFAIKNNSKTILEASDIKICVAIFKGDALLNESKSFEVHDDFGVRKMAYLELPESIFPDQWIKVDLTLFADFDFQKKDIVEYMASVILYTAVGSSEIPIRILA